MYTDGFDQWVKLNKNLNIPFNEWYKTAANIFKQTAEQNLSITTETFSRLTNQLKRFSTLKKPEEFLDLQRDCFNENVTAMIKTSQKITQTITENLQEIMRLFTSMPDPMAATAKAMEKMMEKPGRQANVK